MEKDKLLEIVKEWIQLDNEMKDLALQTRKKRENKKELSNMLIDIMRNNEIDCFDIQDGQLMYCKRITKKSMTKKDILETVYGMFENEPEKASEIAQKLLDNRKEVVTETIKRKNK